MRLMLNTDDGDLVLIENALVVPPPIDSASRVHRSGVLTADGLFVENSRSWSDSSSAVNDEPALPELNTVQEFPGTWMFGGISYGHFGHFLLESLSRMWALDELGDRIDGVLFTPKINNPTPQRAMEVHAPLMRALGITVPTHSTNVPLRVERLYIPRQGIGMGDLSLGSTKFRERVRRHAGKDVAPKGAERIYISRSKLPPMRGGLIGEPVLEQLLAAEGYEMFHPQLQSAPDQVAQYKAARDIISVDCSPLHLVAYVGDADQRVAIMTRRSMAVAQSMADQITTFSGADAFEVNALIRDWVPSNSNRPGRSSFGEIDFPQTYHALKAKGMIASDIPWPPLTEEQRRADLDRIEASHKISFRPLNDTAAVHARPAGAPA